MSTVILEEKHKFVSRITKLAGRPPLTVASADIDGFKAMNDSFGHGFGDRVLELVTRTFQANLPGEAVIARIGGDEFVAALPQTTPEEALILLDEVRQHLAGREHKIGKQAIAIPVSIGLAGLPQHTEDASMLVPAADEALLRAKTEGRNRVAIYIEDKMSMKSNYYSKAQLARLGTLSERLDRTEASLLREGLSELLDKYREHL